MSADAGVAAVLSASTLSAYLGVDVDGNGVADRLDAYVASIPGGPETKAAATAYYRLVSRLATKAMAKQALTDHERQSVFWALSCYSLSARAERVTNRAGLDDEFMRDRNSFKAMHALMSAMSGTVATMTMNRAEMCGATTETLER